MGENHKTSNFDAHTSKQVIIEGTLMMPYSQNMPLQEKRKYAEKMKLYYQNILSPIITIAQYQSQMSLT